MAGRVQAEEGESLRTLLRTARRDAGLTLAQLGSKLGLANGNFIGMVERGERVPSDTKLLELADSLGLDGRHLLTLKYREQPGSAVSQLIEAPKARFPRLRATLLGLCENGQAMRREFERGEYTSLESLIFQQLFNYLLVDELHRDRKAPAALRRRVAEFRRRIARDPEVKADPWWLEEEGDDGIAAVRRHVVSWAFDLGTLTLEVLGAGGPRDRYTIPFIDRELRARMLAAMPSASSPEPPDLEAALKARGLDPAEVEEIVAMVEFKLARKRR